MDLRAGLLLPISQTFLAFLHFLLRNLWLGWNNKTQFDPDKHNDCIAFHYNCKDWWWGISICLCIIIVVVYVCLWWGPNLIHLHYLHSKEGSRGRRGGVFSRINPLCLPPRWHQDFQLLCNLSVIFFSSLSQKGGVKNYHREQRAISEALLGSKGRNASHDSQGVLMHNLMFITAPKGRRLQRELGEGERNLQTYWPTTSKW